MTDDGDCYCSLIKWSCACTSWLC